MITAGYADNAELERREMAYRGWDSPSDAYYQDIDLCNACDRPLRRDAEHFAGLCDLCCGK